MCLKWQECRICDEKYGGQFQKRGLRSCITKPPSSHHTFSDIFAWSESFSLHPQKKLSLITDLLIHSSFTSLLAMDSNSSPENILSSGGNMRISEKGILILLRKMSVGSKNRCFSSDLHTGLRICPQNCSFILRCQDEAEWKWFWIVLIQTKKQTKNVQDRLDAKGLVWTKSCFQKWPYWKFEIFSTLVHLLLLLLGMFSPWTFSGTDQQS